MAEEHAHPITQPRTYFLVFACLIVLTALTVSASFLPIKEGHILIGLAFGTAKAVLVALFFMQLIHSSRLTWLVVAAGLFWLGIMLALTLADYHSRDWIRP
jgi:cytochrome c oxidase subunit 4